MNKTSVTKLGTTYYLIQILYQICYVVDVDLRHQINVWTTVVGYLDIDVRIDVRRWTLACQDEQPCPQAKRKEEEEDVRQ